MAEERTYLELSEEGGSSHKFYEVMVAGSTLTVRYGRIGDKGQTQVSDLGQSGQGPRRGPRRRSPRRRRRATPPPSWASARSAPSPAGRSPAAARTRPQAPLLWKFDSGDRAFGIFVDDARCWVGNESGSIYSARPRRPQLAQFRLPDGVKCIVADDEWLYAGCDDGNVYDLGGKVPRVAYEISEDVDIYWLDIKDGVLGVSDAGGKLTAVNHEDESAVDQAEHGHPRLDGALRRAGHVPRPRHAA